MSTFDRRHQFRRIRVLPSRTLSPLMTGEIAERMPRRSNSEQFYNSSGDISQIRYDIDELTKKLDVIRSHVYLNEATCSKTSKKSHQHTSLPIDSAYCIPPPLPPRTYRLGNAPPKPQRTFAQSLENLSCLFPIVSPVEKMNDSVKEKWSTSIALNTSNDLSAQIATHFKKSVCWYQLENSNDFIFVNPFNDLNDTKCHRYDVIQQLLADISENRDSSILFCGETDSGKSYLAEMLIMEFSAKFSGISAALSSALLIVNTLTNIRNASGKYSSITTNEYRMTVKDGILLSVQIQLLMTELSPALNGEIKLTEIVSRGLTRLEDREKYFLADLIPENSSADLCRQMRDIQLAFSILSISSSDVFQVLFACVLLRKIAFTETQQSVDTESIKEIERAAKLLGISSVQLYLAIIRPFGKNSNVSVQQAKHELSKFVKALYQRCVCSVLQRINIALQRYCSAQMNSSIVSDGESSANDSGIGLCLKDLTFTVIDCFGTSKWTPNFSSFLRNVAAERWSSARESCKNRDINCASLDFVCDIMHHLNDSDMVTNEAKLVNVSFESTAKNIGMKTGLLSIHKSNLMVKHFGGRQVIAYDTTDFISSNFNSLSSCVVNLFRASECTFAFARQLFTSNLQDVKTSALVCNSSSSSEETYRSRIENSYIHDYSTELDRMLSRTTNLRHTIHCISSNCHQEYSYLNSEHLTAQLGILIDRNWTEKNESPHLPVDRNYTIKESKKHSFPQRRVVVTEYHDTAADYTFRVGEVIRISGFANSAHNFHVDIDETRRYTIPTQFTRLTDQFRKAS